MHLSGLSQVYLIFSLGLSQAYQRHTVCIPQPYLRHIPEIVNIYIQSSICIVSVLQYFTCYSESDKYCSLRYFMYKFLRIYVRPLYLFVLIAPLIKIFLKEVIATLSPTWEFQLCLKLVSWTTMLL